MTTFSPSIMQEQIQKMLLKHKNHCFSLKNATGGTECYHGECTSSMYQSCNAHKNAETFFILDLNQTVNLFIHLFPTATDHERLVYKAQSNKLMIHQNT